jgi:pimeloyl-ACP methyl ester carboxylesterase
MRALVPLALFVLLQSVSARPTADEQAKGFHRKRLVAGRPIHGLVPPPTPKLGETVNKGAVQEWFTQKLDHFDPSNTKTWRQKYWYNQAYYKPGGPIFLMLGGESAGSNYWLTYESLEFVKLAKYYGAMVFTNEHRYYGASHPTSDMTTANMKWLTSEQALADIADFITAMNAQYKWDNPKWVTFGGSYSGALSGWFREKYPQLVVGAVATSAPVYAEADFKEYLDVVQTSLRTFSPQCADNVRAGFTEIQRLMGSAAGRTTLKQKLRLCFDINVNNQKDVMYFYESVIGNYMITVQYSQDNVGVYANDLTVPVLCGHMNTNKPIIDRITDVNNMVMNIFGENCLYNSYSGFIDFMRNTQFGAASSDDRSWVYQTCTEFGYYQSTDMANNIFGQELPVSYYLQQCGEIYGSQFTANSISQAVDNTNKYYGGRDNFNATNVVLPNGTVDPWHALGILTSPNPQTNAILITGTAHCADMYPARASDPRELTLARESIELRLATWIR